MSLKVARRPPQGRASPAFARNRKAAFNSCIYSYDLVYINLPFFRPSFQPGPRPFCAASLTLRRRQRRDISIQGTCWHSYQASKSLVSFWKGLTRVMEMLKGVLATNITKGWEDMNMFWLKARKQTEQGKKKQKKTQWNTLKHRERDESARLHFRQRSAELKGGPCTNETQFHATLSLPVLFPGFHFH